jgi:hypothetical protein
MIQQTIKKYKTPIIVTGAVVLGYVGYRYFRKKNINQTQTIKEDEKKFIEAGQKLTYTLTSYVSLADSIFNSFALNTNIFNPVQEKEIFAVFNYMKNDLDVLQLIKSFGKRDAPIVFLRFVIPSLSLGEWLRDALNQKEISELNSGLTRRGILAQF